MLSVKQGGIKYHFKSLWYDSTGDWTQVSRAIGEHSTHLDNEPVDLTISRLVNKSIVLKGSRDNLAPSHKLKTTSEN